MPHRTDMDEDVPVRSFFDPSDLKEDDKFTQDETDERTLRAVYKLLKKGVSDLDRWHAFADGHRQLSELKLKQDIHAHEMAANVLQPILELVEQALATVDEKFRQRNGK